MPKAPRHVPEGHLFAFPDAVRTWMLAEHRGHMAGETNSHVTVYCGETRGSFTAERIRPNLKCRFCHHVVQDGTMETVPGGFSLWHPLP